MSAPKITFIGAGSTVFVKNILGDVFQRPALKSAHIALMDIDETRLEESHIVVRKLMDSVGANGEISCHRDRKTALQGADFVVVAFQIGGYEPCTVTDFAVCKRHGLEQTIADTLGPGGIMRALRTIPHLWAICDDMSEVCPDATMLNYVNPMAMNTWAMYARYPHIKQVGLCHSVQGTAEELARDLDLDPADLRYRCAGINHMAFYLSLEKKLADGSYVSIYPTCYRPTPTGGRRSRTCTATRAAKTSSAMKCSKSWATLSPSPRSISPNTRHGLSSRAAMTFSLAIKCRWMNTLNAASSNWPTGIRSWRAISAGSALG